VADEVMKVAACTLAIGDLKATLLALIENIEPGQNNWKQLFQGFRKLKVQQITGL